jgi:hypothetical protein
MAFHHAKAVAMIGTLLRCGCITTAALVTGPVTSIGSMAWHFSDAGSSCFSIPMAIVAMPVGWVLAAAAGVEKDRRVRRRTAHVCLSCSDAVTSHSRVDRDRFGSAA